MTETCPICRSSVTTADDRCPSCGFKLAGNTRRFKPVMPPADQIPASERPASAVLRTIRGPRAGVDYALGQGEATVGRNPNCTIFLNDMTVSREHARISFEQGSHVIRDEQSFNGVWVNNKNVNAKALVSGDIVQIGAFAFIYES